MTTVLLFVPSEKVEAHKHADDGKQVEFYLKPELEFNCREVDIPGMGETDAEGNEIIREKRFNNIAAAGDERDERTEIGADENADNHDKNQSPEISFLHTYRHRAFLFFLQCCIDASAFALNIVNKQTRSV
jgi:hypothetical protein